MNAEKIFEGIKWRRLSVDRAGQVARLREAIFLEGVDLELRLLVGNNKLRGPWPFRFFSILSVVIDFELLRRLEVAEVNDDRRQI